MSIDIPVETPQQEPNRRNLMSAIAGEAYFSSTSAKGLYMQTNVLSNLLCWILLFTNKQLSISFIELMAVQNILI